MTLILARQQSFDIWQSLETGVNAGLPFWTTGDCILIGPGQFIRAIFGKHIDEKTRLVTVFAGLEAIRSIPVTVGDDQLVDRKAFGGGDLVNSMFTQNLLSILFY